MKTFAGLLSLFLIFSVISFAQDTSIAVSGTGNVGIGTSTPSAKLDVAGNVAVSGTINGANLPNFSNYSQFGNLNYGSVTVTTTPTILSTGTIQFNKIHQNSKIEVYVNSRFYGGIFGNGATGIYFGVELDGTMPDFDNQGSIIASNTDEFLSLYAIFENIGAGTHTISLWGQTPLGSSTGVLVDPGGWGGKIIVKETW